MILSPSSAAVENKADDEDVATAGIPVEELDIEKVRSQSPNCCDIAY